MRKIFGTSNNAESLSESKLIKMQMDELDFKIHKIIINKAGLYKKDFAQQKTLASSEWEKRVKENFPESTVLSLPMQDTAIIGETMLKECCKKISEHF